MKKFLTAGLTAAMVFGASGTSFAEYDKDRHSIGKFRWAAELELDFMHERPHYSDAPHEYHLYLTPEYQFDDKWSLNGYVEFYGDYKKSRNEMPLIYFKGEYAPWEFKVGAIPFYTNEGGLIFDTGMIGAEVDWGDDFYVSLYGGKIEDDEIGSGLAGEFVKSEERSRAFGVNVQYDTEEPGAYGGAGFYYLKDEDFKTDTYTSDGDTDKAHIWSANAGYRFTDKLNLFASYAKNTKADLEKYSWQAQVEYGNYDKYPEQGDWSVWAGYRRYGTNVSFQSMDDDAMNGTRGWVIGGSYAPIKNVGVTARYFKGKFITERHNAEKIFGAVEFYF